MDPKITNKNQDSSRFNNQFRIISKNRFFIIILFDQQQIIELYKNPNQNRSEQIISNIKLNKQNINHQLTASQPILFSQHRYSTNPHSQPSLTMNSPSYYYQHGSQNQLNSQQFDQNYYHNDSLNSFSDEQEYQTYQHTFIPQFNKFNKTQNKQKTKNQKQKIHPKHKNHKHSQSEDDQQKDFMLFNHDRSLKVNQTLKKSHDTINKNKSLSSPSNNPTQKKIFKKSKPNKQSKVIQKSKDNKTFVKPKKKKVSKQKKISNGSLSTDNTKIVVIRPKKTKISQKIQKQKSHHASKSQHNNSQKSNDYLILGQNLYDYQDMSRVNTTKQFYDEKKFMNESLKQKQELQNKKVKFSSQESNLQLRSKNNDLSLSIYDPLKLSKKVNRTISKIEKYMLGFIEAQYFIALKYEALEDTQNLSLETKLQLYHQLLKDQGLARQLQINKKKKEVEKIDDVIRLSIQKVEKKSQKLSGMYEEEKGLITKWKNSKLHQLSTAKKILQRLVQEDHQKMTKKFSHKHYGSQSPTKDPQSTPNTIELQQIQDLESDPLYLLEKQLQQIMNEEYYPQMKRQTVALRKSITQLLKNQQFPQPKVSTQTEQAEQNKLQNTQNYFTPNGVLWFFQKFFTFIVEKPNYIVQIVQKLNEGFGFDVETKKVMAKTKNLQKWYDFYGEGQKSVTNKPIIDLKTLEQFQQQIIKPDPQINEQTQKYMHHFNRAMIDTFNEQFHRFRPFYPNGQPLPNIEKPGKYFQITTQSIFYFFEKAKFHIYTNYITYFAGLILPEGQQETKETKQYNLSKEMKMVNTELLYDWEFHHSLLPVAKLATFEDLYQQTERRILDQLSIDLFRIFKRKIQPYSNA